MAWNECERPKFLKALSSLKKKSPLSEWQPFTWMNRVFQISSIDFQTKKKEQFNIVSWMFRIFLLWICSIFFFSFVECRLSHQNLKFDSECDNKIWCHMKYNARWLLFLSPKFVSIFRVFSPLYRIVRRAISFFFLFHYLSECRM